MKGGIVGKRYAKALLNLAGDDQNIEKIGAELSEMADHYENDEALHNVIHEPKVNKANKVAIIGEIAKKAGFDDLINRYCRYLVTKGRFDIVADISTAYQALAMKKLGKASAKMTVAFGLGDAEKKKLQKQLSDYTGKDITLTVEEDKSILGGAITSIDSLVLDGSIRNRLNLIRESISKGN